MKKLIFIAIIAAFAVPAMAGATFSFSQDTGGWDYIASGSNSGTINFNPIILVDKGLGSTTDPLVGSEIFIPSLTVSYVGTDYVLTPVDSTISIVNGSTTVFEGDLGSGTWALTDESTSATGYWDIKGDINVTSVSNTINSPTLDKLQEAMDNDNPLDFEINMGNSGTVLIDEVEAGNDITDGNISGSASVVPAPGAFLLGGIGLSLVGYIKRRRMLN